MGFFHHIKNIISFQQLQDSEREITFYSEGKNYWPYLSRLLNQLLKTTDLKICYVTSGKDDPGLKLTHPNLKTFKIDTGFVRNWFFENLKTKILIMTMPDLEQYQVKRSKFDVHYIYVQHSPVSLHMTYREGAFDYFDTIFCSGPHHKDEIRALEKSRNTKEKQLFEHGYERLDALIEKHNTLQTSTGANTPSTKKTVLLAPTWGAEMITESGLAPKIVQAALDRGHRLIYRPHPETVKHAKNKIDQLVKAFQNNPDFSYELNVGTDDSLHAADMMICDWSGAALEFALALRKPVLYVDTPRKVNNKNYMDIGIAPIEVSSRDQLGKRIAPEQIDEIGEHIDDLLHNPPKIETSNFVYNPGKSEVAGASEVERIFNTLN